MTSSAIYSEIVFCQTRIDCLTDSINTLHHKIDAQESVLSAFSTKEKFYIDEYTERKRQCDIIDSYHATSVFSYRFQSKMATDFSQERDASIFNAMDIIKQKMKDEIEVQCGILEQQETALRQENSRIEQLNIEHTRAVRAEREEEQQRLAALQRNRR